MDTIMNIMFYIMGIMPLVLCHFRELQAHVHDNTFSPTIDATSINVNNILQKVTALANKAMLITDFTQTGNNQYSLGITQVIL